MRGGGSCVGDVFVSLSVFLFLGAQLSIPFFRRRAEDQPCGRGRETPRSRRGRGLGLGRNTRSISLTTLKTVSVRCCLRRGVAVSSMDGSSGILLVRRVVRGVWVVISVARVCWGGPRRLDSVESETGGLLTLPPLLGCEAGVLWQCWEGWNARRA